ncbi:MAG: polysaccharide deacetylase family protein [Niastella sp.]|uniref:polysaccharide deacetylase family protein n=1 Tax=Niastella sp. TaxID=1869183 RepID=UPI00389A3C5E
MYHKISSNTYRDYLTVTKEDLEEQFLFLSQQGYTPLLLSDLVKHVRSGNPLPRKPVLITFDDGYRDNYTTMYPVLKKYGLKANIFLVPAFLEQGETPQDNYLQLSDLHSMDPNLIEYGLHSYDHKSYKQLTLEEIEQDINKCRQYLQERKIAYQDCLAYPYGAFPKRHPVKRRQFLNTLSGNGIILAFRIGNRLNALPLRRSLVIQRLDIRGDEPFELFKRKLQKGKKLMPF